MTQKWYVARNACDIYFLVNFCGLILTFSGMTFVLRIITQTFTSTLCEFELFAARLTDPSPKCESVFLPLALLWPYLDLYLYLKMLNIH